MAYIIGPINEEERKKLRAAGHELRHAIDVCNEIVEGQTLDDGDECPRCRQGTVGREGEDEFVCRGECGTIFVEQDFYGLNVDNDLFALVEPWQDDTIQFPRLLAEIWAVGVDDETMEALCQSMDLSPNRVRQLFRRADGLWEAMKPPIDFGEQMAYYLRRGLEPAEILKHLDPDTAGEDLIELVRKLMATDTTVQCKFCLNSVPVDTAHRHDGGWVGECCWDEKLRCTE